MHIAFNFDSKDPVLQKLLRTKEFRMAVERSLDRKKIIEQVYSGLAVLGGTPVLPSNKAFYNPAVEKLRRTFDLNAAKALLAGIGLKDANGDGWLDRSDGKPLEIVLMVDTTKEHVETAMLLSENLKKIGVKLEMQSVDAKLFGEKINSGTFDMCIRAFGNQPDPHLRKGIYQPTGNLYYWHISTKDADTKPVFAEMYPWEKELYDIFEQGAIEMDQAKRKALYDRFQAIYADEIPIIFVVKSMNLYGASNKVGNFYINKQGLIVFSPYTVYLKN
jgi:peptide/nickel transport system substrate-binding protein